MRKCLDIVSIIDGAPPDTTIDAHDLLILWMLLEKRKGKKSKFYNILNLLPKTSTCPLALSPIGKFLNF